MAATDYEGVKYFTEHFLDVDEVIMEEMIIQLIGKYVDVTENMVDLIKNKIYSAEAEANVDDEVDIFDSYIGKNVRIIITNRYIRIKNDVCNKTTIL